MEFNDREEEVIRSWKTVTAKVEKLDESKYIFKLLASSSQTIFENVYEDDKHGMQFKFHVNLRDNQVIRKDTHPKFIFYLIGKFSKEGIDTNINVDKKGKVTHGKLQFEKAITQPKLRRRV